MLTPWPSAADRIMASLARSLLQWHSYAKRGVFFFLLSSLLWGLDGFRGEEHWPYLN